MAWDEDELTRFLVMSGLGMMGAKNGWEGLSRGGMFGIQGVDQLRKSKGEQKILDAKLREEEQQAQQRALTLKQAEAWQSAMQGMGQPQPQPAGSQRSVVDAPSWTPQVPAAPQQDQNAVLQKLALQFPAQVKAIFEAQKAGQQEVFGDVKRGIDGTPYILTKDGRPMPLDKKFTPQEKAHFADVGGQIMPLDPYTGAQVGQGMAKSMSPEGRDASSRGWATFNRGELTDIPTGQPGQTTKAFVTPAGANAVPGLQPKTEKPPIEFTVQQTGIANTRDAIQTYRDALKETSPADYLMPNSRAKIGTKYNNMMLQAKEAYKLGVLNGPDYTILQEIVANPNSLRGMSISKGALVEQTQTLDDILAKMAQTTAATHNQPVPNTGSGSGAGAIVDFNDLKKKRR